MSTSVARAGGSGCVTLSTAKGLILRRVSLAEAGAHTLLDRQFCLKIIVLLAQVAPYPT